MATAFGISAKDMIEPDYGYTAFGSIGSKPEEASMNTPSFCRVESRTVLHANPGATANII